MKSSILKVVVVAFLFPVAVGCGPKGLSNVAEEASPSDVEEYKAMIKEADAKFAREMEEDPSEVE
ncbi:MAG: hypothetical protein AAGD07_23955 [Planctomycetota bacterium]